MERELAEQQGVEFMALPSSGFFGKGPAARLAAGGNLIVGLLQAAAIIRRLQPAGIVAAGGFGSFAPLAAARLLNRRYYLLEQNRVPGRVVRYFAPGAAETFLTFPLVQPLTARTFVTGTPLRRNVLDVQRSDDGQTVLVLGGSGGARALSLAAVELAGRQSNLHFIVLTGRRDYEIVKEKAGAAGIKNLELLDFTPDMERLYARASLVISRAGGMVINEILASGIPSILIPFPFATDSHQQANAHYVALQGASLQIDQSRLPELNGIVKQLFEEPERLARLSENARRIARRDAAEVIADRIARQVNAPIRPLPSSVRNIRPPADPGLRRLTAKSAKDAK